MRLLSDLQIATMLASPLHHDVQWVGAKNKDLCMSWSKLEKFEQCPRAFKFQFIDKGVPFDMNNPVLQWGTRVHSAMENYMLKSMPLPADTKRFKAVADQIKNRVAEFSAKGKLKVPMIGEQEWAITANGKYATWMDSKNVFMRNKADLVFGTSATLYTFDWKTGKGKRPKPEQLEVVAMVAKGQPKLSHYTKNKSALVFLEAEKLTPLNVDVTTEGHESLMRKYLEKSIAVVQAFDNGDWALNKTPLCGWCDDISCPYNTRE